MNKSSKGVLYNLVTSYGSIFINMLLSFLSVPISLSYWKNEIYAIWTILTSISTYIGVSGLGVESATGHLMTKNVELKTKIGILKKGIKILLLSSSVMLILVSALFVFKPNWYFILGNFDNKYNDIVRISSEIFIIGVILSLPFNVFPNCFNAFGKPYINTIIASLQNIFNFLMLVVTVIFKLGFPFYILLTSLNVFFFGLIRCIFIIFIIKNRKKEEAALSNNVVTTVISKDNNYKTIFKMGFNLCLYGFAIMTIPSISNLLISNAINAESLIPYSMSYKLFYFTIPFVTNFNFAFIPLLGENYGNNNWEWIQTKYKKLILVNTFLSLFCLLGVLWFAKPFIKIWTGSYDNFPGFIINGLLCLYFFMYNLDNVSLLFINSYNYTKNVWIISWLNGAFFILTSVVLVGKIGVIAIPIGLIVGELLSSVWAYPLVVYKRSLNRLKVPIKLLIEYFILFICNILVQIFLDFIINSILIKTIFDFICFFISMFIGFLILKKQDSELIRYLFNFIFKRDKLKKQ